MTAVAIRGFFSRKLRTTLTAIAIILGVSMIAGTYVLTDTINSSFTSIFKTADQKIDAEITGKAPVQSSAAVAPALPSGILAIVLHTPGVAAAAGEVGGTTQLYDLHGKAIGSTGGAPGLIFSLPPPRFRASSLVAGRWPHGNEIVVDRDTATKHHLRLGQRVNLVTVHGLSTFTIVGFTKFGKVASLGGASVIDAPLPTAQRITGNVGKYQTIVVAAAPGIAPRELVTRIKARIPPGDTGRVQVKTGQQSAQDQASAIGNALNFLTIALLAFGGIAVFVGAFIIFNTFSITVAQRAREFGLLRTLGATRRQILAMVVLEALVLGLGASILGLLAGIGIARGLRQLFLAFNIDLPNAGLVLAGRTIVVALLVGTLVTVLSSLMPAIRATRVPPIAALREGAELPRSRFGHFVPYIAIALAALGVVVLVVSIFAAIPTTGQRLSLIGLGAILLFLGVAMFSPKLVPPLASFVGWPIERFTRITGRLARENTTRNPSRTAITAAALMIGLALVGFVTILAAEFVKTSDDAVNRNYAGSFVIQTSGAYLLPAGVAPAVAHVRGVGTVSAVNGDNAKIRGIGLVSLSGVQPKTLETLYHFQFVSSSEPFAAMGPHSAIIDQDFSKAHKLAVGSQLHIATPAGRHDTLTVVGIYKNTIFFPNLCVRYDTFQRDWQLRQDEVVLTGLAPGAGATATEHRISHLLQTRYPIATVQSVAQFKAQQQTSVNQLLALIYLLLAMSVIVSLFGIINTLVLSVYERTREIGMLRAIGTTRGQIRWMVRWESVITSVIGAVLGLILGIALAMLVTAGLASQQIEQTLPIGQLLLWVVFAILFGIIAAAFPARRAARLDVLQAVSYE